MCHFDFIFCSVPPQLRLWPPRPPGPHQQWRCHYPRVAEILWGRCIGGHKWGG